MQRRAAAIYLVFFLVLGVGSYGYITVVDAQKPTVSLDGPQLAQGDTITVDGREYTVTKLAEEEASGGGHGGGGGGTTITGELTWTNESARQTATLAAGDSTTYQNESWTVEIANESDVSEFTLREELNVSNILAEDPAVEDETVDFQGEPHVVYRVNDSLRPLAEYLPARETVTFAVGDSYPHEGTQTTVHSVTTEEVTLAWTSPANNTVALEEGNNVTLNGQRRVVHFPNANSVKLSRDISGYVTTQNRIDYFHERKNGLWGVSILSFASVLVLVGTAFLPVKD